MLEPSRGQPSTLRRSLMPRRQRRQRLQGRAAPLEDIHLLIAPYTSRFRPVHLGVLIVRSRRLKDGSSSSKGRVNGISTITRPALCRDAFFLRRSPIAFRGVQPDVRLLAWLITKLIASSN